MDRSIFSKVRRIQIKTSKMVTDVLSGEYRSIFKGRGMEFEEVREYQPGDDIRSIDWNVTARMNKPFIKLFSEERELTVMFLVDVSSSMSFGSHKMTKKELIAELCAVLSFTAIKNNDKVGVILFSDHIEKYIPPAKGKKHVLRVIRELLTIKDERSYVNSGTDLNGALEYLQKVIRKRSVCFIVSDFFCKGYEKNIAIAKKRHDLVAIKIEDRLEHTFSATSLVVLEDLETKRQLMVDFSSNNSVRLFEKYAASVRNKVIDFFKMKGMDFLIIKTDEDYLNKLTGFFKIREKRVRR